jgi:diguanylate cyclase (GGDEF)-like protein
VPITGSQCASNDAPVEVSIQDPPNVEPNSKPAATGSKRRMTAPGTFIHILKRRVTESHRFGIPICVMYLKVDDYEVISRKYGAAIARQMLDSAEPALEKVLRETDVLARLDQGEFVAMLPGKSQAEATLVAKKMRAATDHCMLPAVDRELIFRFRHGIAELKANETAQELLARARQAAIAPAPHLAAEV